MVFNSLVEMKINIRNRVSRYLISKERLHPAKTPGGV